MKVYYVTYPLGGIKVLNSALHTHHAGLMFETDDGYREIHYGVENGNVSEYINKPLRDGRHQYYIGECHLPYGEVKQKIIANWHNKNYVFGKRDCWSLVEWFCEGVLHVNKADLDGPIGKRSQQGNAVRHASKNLERGWLNVRNSLGF